MSSFKNLVITDIGTAYSPHAVNAEMGKHIVARAPNGNLYVAYHEWANMSSPWDSYPKGHWGKVFLATSINNGATWSVQTLADMQWHTDLASTSGTCPGYPACGYVGQPPHPRIVVTSAGDPIVVFTRSELTVCGTDAYGKTCFTANRWLVYWDGTEHTLTNQMWGNVFASLTPEGNLCVSQNDKFLIQGGAVETLPVGGAISAGEAVFAIDETGTFHFFYQRQFGADDYRLSHVTRTPAGAWGTIEDIHAFNDRISRICCSLHDSQNMAVYWWEYGGPGRTYIYENGSWALFDSSNSFMSLAHDRSGALLAWGASYYRARLPDGSVITGPNDTESRLLMWQPYPVVGGVKPSVPKSLEVVAAGWERIGYVDTYKFAYIEGYDPPTVTTNPATAITAIAATLNGTLDNDGGENCDCGFEWGLNTNYGNTTATQSRASGQTFAHILTSLLPDTIYHFRAKATNSAGTDYGIDRIFTTLPLSPRATEPIRDIVTLEALRNIEMSAMGRVYINEEGNLVYESRYARSS